MIPVDDGPQQLQYLGQPRPLLLLRRCWKPTLVLLMLAGLAVAFSASAGLPTDPPEGGLSRGGARTLAIFVAALILWVSEAVPLVVTGLGLQQPQAFLQA